MRLSDGFYRAAQMNPLNWFSGQSNRLWRQAEGELHSNPIAASWHGTLSALAGVAPYAIEMVYSMGVLGAAGCPNPRVWNSGSGRWHDASTGRFASGPRGGYPGNDPLQAPPGYTWRGRPGSAPGSPYGNDDDPNASTSLRPDLNHAPPIGPHWDYHAADGPWRIYPNGVMEPKL